jgi:transcriptional antiterminator Rof (Rho-off)
VRHTGAQRGASTPSSGSTSVSRVRDREIVSQKDGNDDDVRKLFSSLNDSLNAARDRIRSFAAEINARSEVLSDRYPHPREPHRGSNVHIPLVHEFAPQIVPKPTSYVRDLLQLRDRTMSVRILRLRCMNSMIVILRLKEGICFDTRARRTVSSSHRAWMTEDRRHATIRTAFMTIQLIGSAVRHLELDGSAI